MYNSKFFLWAWRTNSWLDIKNTSHHRRTRRFSCRITALVEYYGPPWWSVHNNMSNESSPSKEVPLFPLHSFFAAVSSFHLYHSCHFFLLFVKLPSSHLKKNLWMMCYPRYDSSPMQPFRQWGGGGGGRNFQDAPPMTAQLLAWFALQICCSISQLWM